MVAPAVVAAAVQAAPAIIQGIQGLSGSSASKAYQNYLNGVVNKMGNALEQRAEKYDQKLQNQFAEAEPQYFNEAYRRVQLGTRMWVTISKDTYIKGLGIFKIPVTVSVTRSGLSERYWK